MSPSREERRVDFREDSSSHSRQHNAVGCLHLTRPTTVTIIGIYGTSNDMGDKKIWGTNFSFLAINNMLFGIPRLKALNDLVR